MVVLEKKKITQQKLLLILACILGIGFLTFILVGVTSGIRSTVDLMNNRVETTATITRFERSYRGTRNRFIGYSAYIAYSIDDVVYETGIGRAPRERYISEEILIYFNSNDHTSIELVGNLQSNLIEQIVALVVCILTIIGLSRLLSRILSNKPKNIKLNHLKQETKLRVSPASFYVILGIIVAVSILAHEAVIYGNPPDNINYIIFTFLLSILAFILYNCLRIFNSAIFIEENHFILRNAWRKEVRINYEDICKVEYDAEVDFLDISVKSNDGTEKEFDLSKFKHVYNLANAIAEYRGDKKEL